MQWPQNCCEFLPANFDLAPWHESRQAAGEGKEKDRGEGHSVHAECGTQQGGKGRRSRKESEVEGTIDVSIKDNDFTLRYPTLLLQQLPNQNNKNNAQIVVVVVSVCLSLVTVVVSVSFAVSIPVSLLLD